MLKSKPTCTLVYSIYALNFNQKSVLDLINKYALFGGKEGFFSPFATLPPYQGMYDFFFQQGCIIDTCKSELMLDFGLAPCNFATFHLDLIFHTTCVQKMAPSMKTNARQKKKECLKYMYIYIHIWNFYHNWSERFKYGIFGMDEFLELSCIFELCALEWGGSKWEFWS